MIKILCVSCALVLTMACEPTSQPNGATERWTPVANPTAMPGGSYIGGLWRVVDPLTGVTCYAILNHEDDSVSCVVLPIAPHE